MTSAEFQNLKVGNIVHDPAGNKFTIMHITKKTGKVVYAAFMPTIGEKDIVSYSMQNTSKSRVCSCPETIEGEEVA